MSMFLFTQQTAAAVKAAAKANMPIEHKVAATVASELNTKLWQSNITIPGELSTFAKDGSYQMPTFRMEVMKAADLLRLDKSDGSPVHSLVRYAERYQEGASGRGPVSDWPSQD